MNTNILTLLRDDLVEQLYHSGKLVTANTQTHRGERGTVDPAEDFIDNRETALAVVPNLMM